MSKAVTDREIPEEHRTILCAALSVQALPPAVVARYWRVKKCADRINVFPDPAMLAIIAAWDGEQDAAPPKPEVDWSVVPFGAEVTAWFGKKERKGVFQGVAPTGDCFVVINGNPEVREIPTGKVSLLDEALV